MTPRFSLAHLTVLGSPPAEVVHIAADVGYDFVSFRIIPLELPGEPRYPLGTDRAMLRQTKAALRETGLKLLDIEVTSIAGDHAIGNYEPSLEAAAELGGKHVVATSFGAANEHFVDRFVELCRLAQPYGLTVDLEFITFYDIATLAQAYDIVQASGCDNAGILIDMLHFERSHTRLDELDAIPRERFHFAQLCDAPKVTAPTRDDLIKTAREERLYLGEGIIPVRQALSHMPPVPCSLEIAHRKRQQELGYKEFARACLEHARAYFNKDSDQLI